ncbi:hypothetical protein E4U21_003267 [Claviceps maximensis]|nr:hypothetical protein E4U21_003267 [Claviceps maximensis]
MSAPTRIATSRLRLLSPRLAASARSFAASCSSSQELQWPQRTPLGDYYSSILRDPILLNEVQAPRLDEPPSEADPTAQPPATATARARTRSEADDAIESLSTEKGSKPAVVRESTAASTTQSPPPSASREPTPQEKARIIFGSRLLGPADQDDKDALKKAQSTYVSGVLVPPQPEEPDNCCMSGCVNCVWDRFREDMEEWTAKKHEAQARASRTGTTNATDGAGDGHGRSSETGRAAPAGNDMTAGDEWEDEVYRGVPVGFREFMKQEKRLKEKHAREGTVGG